MAAWQWRENNCRDNKECLVKWYTDRKDILLKVIQDFNILISQIAEPEFRKSWQVDVNDGSVAFGSARDNWALSVPFMKKKGISFKDVLNIYNLEEAEK